MTNTSKGIQVSQHRFDALNRAVGCMLSANKGKAKGHPPTMLNEDAQSLTQTVLSLSPTRSTNYAKLPL